MMRDQRLDEQAGKRRVARVNAHDHSQDYQIGKQHTSELGQEASQENDIEAHPLLMDNQAFDGRDKSLIVDPLYNSNPEVKVKVENAKLENQLKYQKRLELQLGKTNTNTPTPRPGG